MENEENYIILLVREAQTAYLKMGTHRVGKHFKKLSFIYFFCFLYTRNSLEKRTENSGVLLN